MQSKNERLDFMNQYANDSTNEVIKQSEKLIASKNIQQNIMKETKEFALQIANSINNSDIRPPSQFVGININSKENQSLEYIKFQLVNDFLESIGCKFTPSVFRHESQNPSLVVERSQIADYLKLRSYDKTPLLVQLIEVLRTIDKE